MVVSDGNGGTAESTVTITITPVNDAPEIGDYTNSTPEDTPVSGQITGTDVDKDELTYTIKTGGNPSNGKVIVNSDGTYTYTPNKDYNGEDSFVVVVSDGNGGTAESTVTITITPVNDAPVTNNYSHTIKEDTSVDGKVVGTDIDGDTLTYSISGSQPNNGKVVVNSDGNYTYTPNINYVGTDEFKVLVDDGKGGKAISTVSIIVTEANDAPTIDETSANFDPITGNYKHTIPEDTQVSGAVKAEDVDGDKLTYTLESDASNGTVSVSSNGSYTYTPDKNFNGNDSFTILVSDGNGGTVIATVEIKVTPVNDNPEVVNLAPTTGAYEHITPEDTPILGQVIAEDPDGDDLTFKLENSPSNGKALVNPDGTYSYAPNKRFFGKDSFTVLVSDGKGGTAIATVNITVTEVNEVPIIDVDSKDYDLKTGRYYHKIKKDQTAIGAVVAIDEDNDVLTYSVSSDPKNGSVDLEDDGSYTYTPNENYIGMDEFKVLVRDADGGEVTAIVVIEIVEEPLDIINFITPNNDNHFDTWVINGIEQYKKNEIILVNRWGDEIKKIINYNNDTNNWDGRNESGNLVPEGTYYYIINLKNGKILKGSILVKYKK